MFSSIRWIFLVGFWLLPFSGCAHQASQHHPPPVAESAADSQSGPAGPSQGAQQVRGRADAAATLGVSEAAGEEDASPAEPPAEEKRPCCVIDPKEKRHDPVDPIEAGREGNIVSTKTVGGRLVLKLDKGSDSGIAVGTEGVVLEGKSGRYPLDDGSFRVIEIFDRECVVVSQLKKRAPRNVRVIFFTQH